MVTRRLGATLASLLVLGGCVSTPQAPTVPVMPGPDKSLDQFRADAGVCQRYAQSAISGLNQAAQDNAAANAVGGAMLGAAVGALIGSASGQSGSGAAWGAGAGLMVGGTEAGRAGASSSYTLQRQYDIAYMQCMYTRGHQVPGQVARRTLPAGDGSVPSYAPAQPPVRYNAPPNAVAPPPNTPPPPGYGPPSE